MEDRNEYLVSSPNRAPIVKPKKISDNPFYALALHKRKVTPKNVRKLDQVSETNKSFPRRKQLHQARSKTVQETQIELPKITQRKWQPKKVSMYYNLNFLIQQTKRELKTLHY